MQEQALTFLAIVASLLFLSCDSGPFFSQTDKTGELITAKTPVARTYFLVIGKGKIADPPQQQERAIIAVQRVAAAAKSSQPEAVVDSLAEQVITKEQFRQGEANETVTGAIFRERLQRLAETATPQDSVIIYTHSHGRKRNFEEQQPLGGIVLGLPVLQSEHAGTFLWDEYTELLLKIPAKNVVVLTMSCFSGGLSEYLNSPQVKACWQDRSQREGRNFIVLTSQNKDLVSPPIIKNGEAINPFTLAVTQAFTGEADGFELRDGKAASTGYRDGKLSLGELIDYILYATENVSSEEPRRRNIAKPQLTGSFNRSEILFERLETTLLNSSNENTPSNQ